MRFLSRLFGSKKKVEGDVRPAATLEDFLAKLKEFASVSEAGVTAALKSIDETTNEMKALVEAVSHQQDRAMQIVSAQNKMAEIQRKMYELYDNRRQAIGLKTLIQGNTRPDDSDFEKQQRKQRLFMESLTIAKLDVKIWLVRDAGDKINTFTLEVHTPWPGRDE